MSKILYYCDLHHGSKRPAYDEKSVFLHGDFALRLQAAISTYVSQNNIHSIIHGGDEAFFDLDKDRFKARAEEMANSINLTPVPVHRVIGNHEPISYLEELGFLTSSFNNTADGIPLVVLQPTIHIADKVVHYQYDPDSSLDHIEQVTNGRNIIVPSHWALDRIPRGYNSVSGSNKGYRYHDNTEVISKRLAEFADGNTSRVLGLHGHEHRFAMTTTLGFTCLTMPSIVQADLDNSDLPCGLFAEITDDGEDGSLRIAFKKITFHSATSDNFTVHDVTKKYMDRYFRPVI